MPKIEISEVNSSGDRNAFIKFPWSIYRNDPAWVPPLILERKEFLDRKRHPFYKHGDAAPGETAKLLGESWRAMIRIITRFINLTLAASVCSSASTIAMSQLRSLRRRASGCAEKAEPK